MGCNMRSDRCLGNASSQQHCAPGARGRTKMKAIFRVFAFSLCATLVIFSPPHASAQSSGGNACAFLAAKITARFPVVQQVIRDQVYSKCLQSRGQMAIPGANAAAINSGTYTTFDAPGSTVIYPVAINPEGEIIGYYFDAGSLTHSFLRTRDGTLTPFDPPGATCSLSTSSGCSASNGINPEGTITGWYTDASGVTHGFLRTRDGTFTTFDAPGSAGTVPAGINPAGAITGAYFVAGSLFLTPGFVRTPGGTFITFNPPNSTQTAPVGINPEGAIAGQSFVFLAPIQYQGFLRGRDGSFATFNPPNSTYTKPVGINPEGAITGWYTDASSVTHGFLRTRDGTLITIDAPGAGTGSFEGTVTAGINAEGTITGNYFDANFSSHGFLRTRAGTFTTFDPPGSNGTTFPSGINDAGAVTGNYFDAASNVLAGFLRSR